MISQLRQVRKTTKGESDSAVAERNELRTLCTSLQEQVASLEQRLSLCSASAEAVPYLRDELAQAQSSLFVAEKSLEAARRRVALLEKDLYDKDSELEVTRSDMLLVRQELDRRALEVGNLKEAVHQVEAERSFTVARMQREHADRVEELQRATTQQQAQLQDGLSLRLQEEQARCAKLAEAAQDAELLQRRAELEFGKEKKKMQRTLENALAQLSNSQQEVIDRMLVANLIVSYFKRRRYGLVLFYILNLGYIWSPCFVDYYVYFHRSTDVLKIIAKVLCFDDEQLIAVGLKVPPIDIMSTILSTVMGKPAPAPDVEVNTFYN